LWCLSAVDSPKRYVRSAMNRENDATYVGPLWNENTVETSERALKESPDLRTMTRGDFISAQAVKCDLASS
jgi:hypothetical protein